MIYFVVIVMLLLCTYNIYLQVHEIRQNKILKNLKKDNSYLQAKLKLHESSNDKVDNQ